jgi:ribosomal-protein-serine acetyltransferase
MTVPLGDRAALRPLAESDADELHAVITANRAHLLPRMPWTEQDRAGTVDFLRGAVAQAAANEGLHFAVLDGGRIVGVAGIHRVDWRNRSASIGYWLAADAQGRGLITRAVAALLDHAFGPWELNRVEVRAAPDNARSRAVAERLGFAQEGVLREAQRHTGRYDDLVVYALLAAEWRQPPR